MFSVVFDTQINRYRPLVLTVGFMTKSCIFLYSQMLKRLKISPPRRPKHVFTNKC